MLGVVEQLTVETVHESRALVKEEQRAPSTAFGTGLGSRGPQSTLETRPLSPLKVFDHRLNNVL